MAINFFSNLFNKRTTPVEDKSRFLFKNDPLRQTFLKNKSQSSQLSNFTPAKSIFPTPTGELTSEMQALQQKQSSKLEQSKIKTPLLPPISSAIEQKPPEAPKLPIEPPKLARDDFKAFYEGISGVSEVEKAQKAFEAQKESEQKAFEESQKAISGLITKSDELFRSLFDSPEMKQAKEDRGKAFTELQRIDAEEAEATQNLREAIRQKGTPSWAAAGQLRIVSEGYNGIRAKQLANFAIANDALEQGAKYAESAYNHGINVLESQIGLVENTLKRATTLTEQERKNYEDTLTRAKEVYESKKKDKDAAVATYIDLTSKGISGLSPEMGIDEMIKVAGPILVKQAQENRELELSEKRANIVKINQTSAGLTATDKNNLLRVSNQFSGRPEVKDFREMGRYLGNIDQAMKEARETNNFIAVDQTLINAFNKLNDPTSVVRESEYARTANDLKALSKIRGKWEKILSGGAGLTQDDRGAIARMAKNFYSAATNRYNEALNENSLLAASLGVGEEFDLVFSRKEINEILDQDPANVKIGDIYTAPDGTKYKRIGENSFESI